MNSDQVYEALENIAGVGSTTSKQHALGIVIDDPLMLRVLKAASDPFTTYGVTAPDVQGTGGWHFGTASEDLWKMLGDLAARRLTGNEAQESLLGAAVLFNAPSFEVIKRILNRDLRCGITAKTINKVRPGTIRVFEVMLAHPFEEKRVKSWPVAIEPKLDGVRVTCIVKDGEAEFYSRTGKPFPAVAHLKSQAVEMVKTARDQAFRNEDPDGPIPPYLAAYQYQLGAVILDGEMITSGHFNQTSGDVRRQNVAATGARYVVFDAMPYNEFTSGKIEALYPFRREMVEFITRYAPDREVVKAIPRYFANSAEEIQRLYQGFRDRGLEGAIVKPLTGLYEKKRSHAWMKLKNEETVDLVVEDRFMGEGKYAGMLGGLIVDLDGVKVRVGGGFTDAQRIDFWEKFDQVKGRMIEIEFHEKTPDGSLRHPRFVRFRDDKHEKVAA